MKKALIILSVLLGLCLITITVMTFSRSYEKDGTKDSAINELLEKHKIELGQVIDSLNLQAATVLKDSTRAYKELAVRREIELSELRSAGTRTITVIKYLPQDEILIRFPRSHDYLESKLGAAQ